MMNRLLLFALLALGALSASASAQQASSAFIVSTCGTLPAGVVYAAGQFGIVTMDTTGQLCDGSSGGGGGASATFGAAFPATGTPPGFTIGGLFQPWSGATAGGVNYGFVGVVDNTGTQLNGYTIGTAGTASTQVLTVQGIASMTPIVTNQTQIGGAAFSLGPQPDTASLPNVMSPTSSATAALSHASTTALGTSLVAKASAGNLYGFNCAGIAGGSGGNCIAYNGTTAPSTGALTGANVLDFCTFDTGTKGCSLSRIPLPVNYGTGIVILISSAASPYTYTIGVDTGAISADYK